MDSIVLQTGSTTVTDGDVIGRVGFAASSETGTNARLVVAKIEAIAEESFDASNNATEMVFSLAADGASASKMTLTSAGNLNIAGELQTTNIGYTDGDNSMTIADGGKVTFAAGFAVGSDAAGDILYHNGTSYVRLAIGTDGQVLTVNDAANAPQWEAAAGGGSGGTVQGTDGTYDIQPTNEGATTGNTRGESSVDLQTNRSAATQVASATASTISGGSRNTASGFRSTVSGGYNNAATGGYSSIGGGHSNTSSGYYSTIAGGSSNTASLYHAAVGGGKNNTASNYYATVAGGNSNTASSRHSTVGGGRSNTASGFYSTIIGGDNNTASSFYCTVIGGKYGKSTLFGGVAHAAGRFASAGDAQHLTLVARDSTTDATANQVMFLDGLTRRLVIPAETTWMFTIKLAAHNDTNNDGGWWYFRGGIARDASGNTSLIGSVTSEYSVDSNISTATAEVVADDTNDALEIRVTGVASKNIRWLAVADISQVSWGTP